MSRQTEELQSEKPSIPERSEGIAGKFFDMAESSQESFEQHTGAENQKAVMSEFYENVAREVADGKFDNAQLSLEKGAVEKEQGGKETNVWHDDLRGLAVEINELDREERGEQPMTIQEALDVIDRRCSDLEKVKDAESSEDLQKLLKGISREGDKGIEGLDNALHYTEGVLTTAERTRKIKGVERDVIESVKETRAVRDALYIEKMKRLEEAQQNQQTSEQSEARRGSVTSTLENLYSAVGVLEEVPSRQELMSRVGQMSEVELSFLDDELREIYVTYNARGNKAELDAALLDLSQKGYSYKEVEERYKDKDANELFEVRQILGIEPSEGKDERRELIEGTRIQGKQARQFEEEKNESDISGADQENIIENPFKKAFSSPEVTGAFSSPDKSYTKEKAVAAIADVFQNLYPDTEKLTERLSEVTNLLKETKEKSKRDRPGISEFAYRNFGNNTVMKSLTKQERTAIEEYLDKNGEQIGDVRGKALSFNTSVERSVGAFLDYIEKIQ